MSSDLKVNDKRILDLKKKIETKEKQLEESKKRFAPITNCLLQLDGKTYNLHALNKEDVDYLLVKMHSMVMAAKDLDMEPETLKVSGFNLVEWETDIKARKNSNSVTEQTTALKAMKARLHELLSSDKKVELAIDDIEKSLT